MLAVKNVLRFQAIRLAAVVAAVAAIVAMANRPVQAQLVQQAVGGVWIDAAGVLRNVDPLARPELSDVRAKALAQVNGNLNQPAALRMVSLRRLQETIAALQKANPNQALPDEVRYLAGLQRVQYVFVDPEHHDVVLAGPADGWKMNDEGEVVGRTSGRPVLQLDDLLVALRTADAARNGGVSCSIDPTKEGLKQFQEFISHQKTIGDPAQTLAAIEKNLGPQNISVNGVPDSSRFAHVLVAADFRMKRLAMDFEPAPVKGMPSYLEMIQAGSKVQNLMPRWWLAANYEPLLKDPDGLAWELRGTGVKCMTQEDYIAASGDRTQTGKSGAAAQKWADLMTAKYEELAAHDSEFGQLRNCMDLSVVAALVVREHLADKADCRLDLLQDDKRIPLAEYNAPKQVDSKASMIKRGRNYLISASGGVQFQPWAVVEKREESKTAGATRSKALDTAKTTSWWWD